MEREGIIDNRHFKDNIASPMLPPQVYLSSFSFHANI